MFFILKTLCTLSANVRFSICEAILSVEEQIKLHRVIELPRDPTGGEASSGGTGCMLPEVLNFMISTAESFLCPTTKKKTAGKRN